MPNVSAWGCQVKGDIEDVKSELALQIRSTAFLTVLTTVDTEKGATVATPGPTAVYEGEKANITDVGYPVCEVIGVKTTYDSADQQTKSATHEIEVMWTQVGDDELTITRQLQRLARATRDLFWPATGPASLTLLSTWPIAIVSEEYTALMPALKYPFVKAVATRLHVMTETL